MVESAKMTSVKRKNGQLFYEALGSGPEILLAFHGFGQTGSIFKAWAEKLDAKYTIYAFDLFYHGESVRPFSKLSKEEWGNWLNQFLVQENIKRFSILGYSLGGRFAISAAIICEKRINELILVAPDGIYLTPWFKLATTPGIRMIFKYLMTHPDRMERLLTFNDRSRIVNQYVADFARKEMGDLENRKRVYISWNYFRTLGYSHPVLIRNFKNSAYKKRLIIGKRDHIIKPAGILPIIEKAGKFQVHQLPMKHHQLSKPEVAELLLTD